MLRRQPRRRPSRTTPPIPKAARFIPRAAIKPSVGRASRPTASVAPLMPRALACGTVVEGECADLPAFGGEPARLWRGVSPSPFTTPTTCSTIVVPPPPPSPRWPTVDDGQSTRNAVPGLAEKNKTANHQTIKPARSSQSHASQPLAALSPPPSARPAGAYRLAKLVLLVPGACASAFGGG